MKDLKQKFNHLKRMAVIVGLCMCTTGFAEVETSAFEARKWLDLSLSSSILERAFMSIPHDVANIAQSPFENPGNTRLALGVVGGLVVVDRPVTAFYQDHVENSLDLYSLPTLFPADFISSEFTGGADGYLIYGLAASYLGGVVASDEKTQVAALLSAKAITYSFVVSHLIGKSITGRNRPKDKLSDCSAESGAPSDTCDPYDFGHIHEPYFDSRAEATAMPSFHATMFFSVAKVYQEIYDDYWLPYSTLAVLFASNIKGHNHWVSDLVAGAIVGTMIGHETVRSYQGNYKHVSIAPTYNGFSVSIKF